MMSNAAEEQLSGSLVEKFPAMNGVDDDSSSSHSEGDNADIPSPPYSDSEANNGKDSGVDCESLEVSPEPPSEELVANVLRQVEFYFSDVNILKDPFLLKHVRRNKDGYVSIKLIASFRKVRSLCKNWKTIALCLQKSEKLLVNTDCTKVKRKCPLPDYDETTPSRTVLVYNLPQEKPTVESVSELFSPCGEIALVRILRPGSSIPPDVKQFLQKNPSVGSRMSALVEFEDYKGAVKGLEMDEGKTDWRGLHVIPLIKKQAKGNSQKKHPESTDGTASLKKKKKNKNSKSRAKNDSECLSEAEHPSPRTSRSSSGSSQGADLSSSPRQGPDFRYRLRAALNSSGSPPKDNHFSNYFNDFQRFSDGGRTPPSCGSPWRRRREMAAAELLSNQEGASGKNNPNSAINVPVIIIRPPRGPDGTNGFNFPRNAPTLVAVNAC